MTAQTILARRANSDLLVIVTELTRLTDYYEMVLTLSRLVLKHIYIEDIVASEGDVEYNYSVKKGYNLAMLELPTRVNTADVGEFGRESVEHFSDFISRTVG